MNFFVLQRVIIGVVLWLTFYSTAAWPGESLSLGVVEQMALQLNPTLSQEAARIASIKGRWQQAGLYPNPVAGYKGEDLSTRAPGQTSKHFIFLEQTFITAGKLSSRQGVLEQERMQAESNYAAQRQRILTAVHSLFYEALGAQKSLEVQRKLAAITVEAVKISEDLYNIGQADRPDVLAAETEAKKNGLELIKAENRLLEVWQKLSAVVGNPTLALAPLEGNLEEKIPGIEEEGALSAVLRESPEMKMARLGLRRGQALLKQAQAERVPNFSVRVGLGYNLEELERDRPVGVEGFVEIGVPLPIFNRNQGNIAAAEAEILQSEQEIKRQELILRTRFVSAYRRYQNSLKTAESYRKEILPGAERSYQLYLARFREMAAAYPQVLIAQRTYFQLKTEYIQALVEAWKNVFAIQGFLPGDALGLEGSSWR